MKKLSPAQMLLLGDLVRAYPDPISRSLLVARAYRSNTLFTLVGKGLAIWEREQYTGRSRYFATTFGRRVYAQQTANNPTA